MLMLASNIKILIEALNRHIHSFLYTAVGILIQQGWGQGVLILSSHVSQSLRFRKEIQAYLNSQFLISQNVLPEFSIIKGCKVSSQISTLSIFPSYSQVIPISQLSRFEMPFSQILVKRKLSFLNI